MPETLMSGETANFSSLCDFNWFQWIWFRDTKAAFPNDSRVLGRYLGPGKSIGPKMCMHVLKSNERVIQQMTVRPLTQAELSNDAARTQMDGFMHEM
jgi:hypothetical protein